MDTKRYIVEVWKTEKESATHGPDFNEIIDTYTPEEAVKMILEAKKVTGMFHAEVHLKGNKIDCWVFNDESAELHS